MAASRMRVAPHNLPAELTSFIGREREIAQVRAFLARTRLLTLTGAGGAGKSRLAVRVAAEACADFPDGAWIVELAPLADPLPVPQVVAAVLNVPEQPGRPLNSTLVDALRLKSLLLVLDNCEHVLEACAGLTNELLRSCPDLRILATSRLPLGVAGETLWRVPSLSLPDAGRPPSADEIGRSEAVRLFVERARAGVPEFAVTSGNAPSLARLCHHLDGMPLAIELAAARTKVLSVEQIAARVDDRFRLLTGGTSTALPRHQTLLATMDWSYNLLADRERMLLRRLSVFAGGWTLEAAEAICGGGGVEAGDVLDALGVLVDNSLATAETQHGAARYRALETVRQYGRDRLVESGEAGRVRRRHREWHLRLAEGGDAGIRGPDEGLWFGRLEAEHDNLRAAIDSARADEGDVETELRLVRGLEWFWHVAGYHTEGRARLEEALDRALDRAGAASPLLPKVIVGALRLAYRQGDRARAAALCDQGLALSRRLGDRTGEGCCLLWRGILAMVEGDIERAGPPLADSLAIFREIGDRWWTVESLSFLGHFEVMRGDVEAASALQLESLAVGRDTGNPNNISTALRNLAHLALRRGDDRQAAAYFAESLTIYQGATARGILTECVDGLARVASAQRRHERAARLFGAAERSLAALGGPLPMWADVSERGRYLARTRAVLGDDAFGAAFDDGRAMTLEQAVDYALTGASETAPDAGGAGAARAGAKPSPLTSREREVAALVARGLTNREIAAALVVTERTAETHVQNILNKLGFTSRTQVAAWAVEQGLGRSARPQ